MSFERFEALLERAMGLNVASIGPSAIERAVQARLRACRLDDADDYWARIQRSPDEVQELVEAVVVPETWFFRDPQAFAAMVRIAREEWLPAHSQGVLRLLSLPCSTGEEPYTMAMALLDAGVPADRFRIDAIDISAQAVGKARRGIYGANSFRSRDLGFRDRYFEPVERGFRIGDSVRAPVRFLQGNLLDASPPSGGETYDLVFCRNLLIYFDVETQNRAVGVLKRMLAPQGVLFVGHSESGLMLGQGLASAKIPMAFAFRRAAPPSAAKEKPAPRRAFQPVPPPARKPQQRPAFVHRRDASPPAPRTDSAPELETLRSLADRGELAEAAQGCEAHVRVHGVSAEALYLLGLICDAGGDAAAAARHYRKALYLAPDHAEALGHLALLLRKQGDAAGAKVLDDRLRRLDARGSR